MPLDYDKISRNSYQSENVSLTVLKDRPDGMRKANLLCPLCGMKSLDVVSMEEPSRYSSTPPPPYIALPIQNKQSGTSDLNCGTERPKSLPGIEGPKTLSSSKAKPEEATTSENPSGRSILQNQVDPIIISPDNSEAEVIPENVSIERPKIKKPRLATNQVPAQAQKTRPGRFSWSSETRIYLYILKLLSRTSDEDISKILAHITSQTCTKNAVLAQYAEHHKSGSQNAKIYNMIQRKMNSGYSKFLEAHWVVLRQTAMQLGLKITQNKK
ncbi:hypothetical protein H072_5274 [Dactylellina haptotyla CBS 200.50]|uniref:Uncharacterized protein n=1 Tax=Dactylellina haptotyla (strain CBS 200.50) TaxID=1284197 RepID=S8AIA6_DACHA|nr:hypothetical protein H072_5274 [Dactylellina haptotyla CBS 200.50]